MASTGYLIRTELKKQIGGPAEDFKVCFVLPAPDSKLSCLEAAEKALDLVIESIHQISRYPVIEEISRQRVFVEDLRPLRNSVLLEKDGWKCFSIRR
jgi:hypothetical protein